MHLNGWQLSRLVVVCKAWRALICGTEEWWRRALAEDFAEGWRMPAGSVQPIFQGHVYDLVKAARPQNLYRFRRVPSALRSGALRHAQAGLQSARRERDKHVPAALEAATATHFREQVEVTLQVEAVGALGAAVVTAAAPATLARIAEIRTTIEQAAARERDARRQDPRTWDFVMPRERVTWSHGLRGKAVAFSRSHLAAANAVLQAWWVTVNKPWQMFPSEEEQALVKRRPRRLFVPAPLRQGGSQAAYQLYQMLAANLLRGRCRCCNRMTSDMHATIGVRMCAVRQCAGAYPIRQKKATAVVSAAAPAAAAMAGAAAAITAANAVATLALAGVAPQLPRRPAWRPRNAGKRKPLKS
jgi:hypothetical protein